MFKHYCLKSIYIFINFSNFITIVIFLNMLNC